jgi:DNA-binding NtrC family response regulator
MISGETLAAPPDRANTRFLHSSSPSANPRHANSSKPPTEVAALIYVVDDDPTLTELYYMLLEPKGHVVRTFTDREQALSALRSDNKRPNLLITDYLGHLMPANTFINCCRIVHPALRILIASGFYQLGWRFSLLKPDGFIQKPFTAEAFLQEVQIALTA